MALSYDPLNYLRRSLELNPSHQDAAYMYAKYLIQNREFLEAVTYLNHFINNFEENSRLRNLLAQAFLQLEKFDEAQNSVNIALSHTPRSINVLHTAFVIKKAIGDKFSALHFLERIVSLGDPSVEILCEMADLLDCTTELERKINILDIAYSINPKNREIFDQLAVSFLKYFKNNAFEELNKHMIEMFLDHFKKYIPAYFSIELQKEVNQWIKKFKGRSALL